jgi:predicted phosphohydrolase
LYLDVLICFRSDTHSLTNHIKFSIPPGDVFIHAGDFSKCGRLEEVVEFNNWLGTLPHKHKLVIAGNHELSFDPCFTHPFHTSKSRSENLINDIPTLGNPKENIEAAVKTQNIRQYLTNCIYLEDSGVELFGLKFYGTPYQPEFCKWAFNLPRGDPCLEKWNLIPSDVDILITHTPPIGFGDLCCSGIRAGCVELLTTVQKRLKNVKYHIYGHVHESYGIYSDGRVIYINASTCDLNYLPNNCPIVFDVTTKK